MKWNYEGLLKNDKDKGEEKENVTLAILEEKTMKKLLAMTLSSFMFLGALAGCATGEETTTSTGGGSTTGGSTTTTPSGGNDTTSSDGDIVVGMLANTTGAAAQYGVAVANGANFYFDLVNEEGGINGKEIVIKQYDDKGDESETLMLFERLKGEGVTAVLGSVLTGPTTALAYETYAVNMPQITASATAPTVTVDEDTGEVRSNVFRSCFIDSFQGEKMAEYASEVLGATTAGVIFNSGSDYSVGLKDAFVARCAEIGLEVVGVEGYADGDVAFQAQLTSLDGKSPDVIFAPNYYQDVGLIVTQARQQGSEAIFMGGDGWAGVSGYASAEDLEGSVFCSGFSGDAEFEAAYQEKYNTSDSIGMFEALAYDAAMILVEAIIVAEESGEAAGSDEYKQEIIDAMKATDGLEGLTGSFKFDENNNPIKSASMMVLTDGVETFSEQF